MGPAPPTDFADLRPSNLDGALRYFSVVDLLADRYRPDLRVLEVGSGAGGVTQFLRHPVTGVDPAFERSADAQTEWLTPIEGRVERLPLPDESFDVVLSVEMLEHLPPAAGRRPPAARERAFAEMFRVLAPGGRMIVTFPADAVGERLDRRFNKAYRLTFRKDHPWLEEHIANGLPRTAEVRAIAERAAGDASVRVLKNAWGPAGCSTRSSSRPSGAGRSRCCSGSIRASARACCSARCATATPRTTATGRSC